MDAGRVRENDANYPDAIFTIFYFCKRINTHYYSHIIAIRKEKMYFLFLTFCCYGRLW